MMLYTKAIAVGPEAKKAAGVYGSEWDVIIGGVLVALECTEDQAHTMADRINAILDSAKKEADT